MAMVSEDGSIPWADWQPKVGLLGMRVDGSPVTPGAEPSFIRWTGCELSECLCHGSTVNSTVSPSGSINRGRSEITYEVDLRQCWWTTHSKSRPVAVAGRQRHSWKKPASTTAPWQCCYCASWPWHLTFWPENK